MYILSFETSSKVFSLALSRDGKVLRHRNLKSGPVLEDFMLPAMDKLLKSAGTAFDRIDAFAVALGPGSFTSLRVGMAMVKAFVMASGKPLVGIPSLDIIARGLATQPCDEICVLNDARRGMVYAAIYGCQEPAPVRKSAFLLSSLDDILDQVHGRTLFGGDALGLYRKDIEAAYQKYARKSQACKCLFADEKFWYPQARVMSVLAYERLQKKITMTAQAFCRYICMRRIVR